MFPHRHGILTAHSCTLYTKCSGKFVEQNMWKLGSNLYSFIITNIEYHFGWSWNLYQFYWSTHLKPGCFSEDTSWQFISFVTLYFANLLSRNQKLIKRERNLSSYRVQMRIDCQKSQGWSLKPSEMGARLKIQEGSVSRSNFAGQWPSAMPLSFKQSFSWLTWPQHFLQGIWPFSAFKLEPPLLS